MTISSVSGSTALTYTPPDGPPPGASKVMEPAAQLLGMSTDDLQTQLKSGSTLDDLATSKGVSHDDLIAAITQGLQANAPAGADAAAGTAATGGVDLTQMAEGIAAGKGPGGHGGHGHHHHAGGGGVDALGETGDTTGKLQDLSDALGTDPDTLLSQLMGGDTSEVGDASSTPYSSASALPTSGLAVDYRA